MTDHDVDIEFDTVRTPEEIDNEIRWFEQNRQSIPARTVFGENNWQKIDGIVLVLGGTMSMDDIDAFEYDPDNEEQGMDLRADMRATYDWMTGDEDDAPSKGWASLVGLTADKMAKNMAIVDALRAKVDAKDQFGSGADKVHRVVTKKATRRLPKPSKKTIAEFRKAGAYAKRAKKVAKKRGK